MGSGGPKHAPVVDIHISERLVDWREAPFWSRLPSFSTLIWKLLIFSCFQFSANLLSHFDASRAELLVKTITSPLHINSLLPPNPQTPTYNPKLRQVTHLYDPYFPLELLGSADHIVYNSQYVWEAPPSLLSAQTYNYTYSLRHRADSIITHRTRFFSSFFPAKVRLMAKQNMWNNNPT